MSYIIVSRPEASHKVWGSGNKSQTNICEKRQSEFSADLKADEKIAKSVPKNVIHKKVKGNLQLFHFYSWS